MDEWSNDFFSSISIEQIKEDQSWEPKIWGVIGASGFIGKAVCEGLEKEGFEVVKLKAPRLSLISADRNVKNISESARSYSEKELLARKLAKCDVVVNAAGLATPDGAEKDILFGANSLLPAVLLESARIANVGRFIHLSSAAVQGNRKTIDESISYSPFSDYSLSKALGEAALFNTISEFDSPTELVVIRATSVQGRGRQTTKNLKRISRSLFSSVSAPGNQPTVVSSLPGLVSFVRTVGLETSNLNPVQLQPWEKVSVSQVLEAAGGRKPLVIPRRLCQTVIGLAHLVTSLIPKFNGPVRRLELMWFGQTQNSTQYEDFFADSSLVLKILEADE
ncbi:NAD-dependent epimerase/dehydratase family protein [Corynebacterium glutamicum]|uniref:NAD-dependent epimerase/dehydratase family protein n=1 Tax=Corynebacterium glutamicum TaxID=1718 RepID=UPI003C7B7BE0